MNAPDVIRVCLNMDGTAVYFPWYGGAEGDYTEKPMDAALAIRLMVKGIPVEIATKDPSDIHPHNYESPQVRLQRV